MSLVVRARWLRQLDSNRALRTRFQNGVAAPPACFRLDYNLYAVRMSATGERYLRAVGRVRTNATTPQLTWRCPDMRCIKHKAQQRSERCRHEQVVEAGDMVAGTDDVLWVTGTQLRNSVDEFVTRFDLDETEIATLRGLISSLPQEGRAVMIVESFLFVRIGESHWYATSYVDRSDSSADVVMLHFEKNGSGNASLLRCDCPIPKCAHRWLGTLALVAIACGSAPAGPTTSTTPAPVPASLPAATDSQRQRCKSMLDALCGRHSTRAEQAEPRNNGLLLECFERYFAAVALNPRRLEFDNIIFTEEERTFDNGGQRQCFHVGEGLSCLCADAAAPVVTGDTCCATCRKTLRHGERASAVEGAVYLTQTGWSHATIFEWVCPNCGRLHLPTHGLSVYQHYVFAENFMCWIVREIGSGVSVATVFDGWMVRFRNRPEISEKAFRCAVFAFLATLAEPNMCPICADDMEHLVLVCDGNAKQVCNFSKHMRTEVLAEMRSLAQPVGERFLNPSDFWVQLRRHYIARAFSVHLPPPKWTDYVGYFHSALQVAAAPNSEYRKIETTRMSASRPLEMPEVVTLRSLSDNATPAELRAHLAAVGVYPHGNTQAPAMRAMIQQLADEHSTCGKAFTKPTGTIGGHVRAICPHGTVVAEKVRSFVGLVLIFNDVFVVFHLSSL